MSKGKAAMWRKSFGVVLALLMVVFSLSVAGCGQSTAAKKSTASPADLAAAKRGYILIGNPTCLTGQIASFGEGTQWITDRALAAINKNGGIYIKSLGKKLPVRVKAVDTQSSATVAAQVATELVTKDHVNMMLVLHTPDTVNPVSSIGERYHVPTVALDDPVDDWLAGGPYKWSYDAFWTDEDVIGLYMGMWTQYASQTDKVVGILCPNDPDGVGWAKVFATKLPAAGYKMVDPGRFPDNTNDFTSVISQFKQQHVQIVTGVLPPPVFATVWRQMKEQGFTPKILTMGKALLFPSDVTALGGNLPDGLTSEVWWTPGSPFKSSLTGETPAEVLAAYTKATGKAWTATIGFDYAGLEIINNVLTRAGSLDPNKILAALGATDMNTIVGPIKYNAQHYSRTPLVGGQWQKGADGKWVLKIVYDAEHPNIPTTGKMLFPLPQ